MTPLAELVSLRGKVAVVTGAAQGIGAAIVARFEEAGAEVMAIDRTEADVTDAAALARAVEGLDRIDIWVNNAGAAPRRPVLEITPDEWDAVFALNLRAALVGSQLGARRMIAGGRGGVILNLVSSSIHRVSANPAHYRASKMGLVALTQNLAVELGRHGIRVVAIAPTLTDTPQVQALRLAHGAEGFDEFARRLPLRRMASADEVARVALFAASELASFVTGSVIDVDGGEAAK